MAHTKDTITVILTLMKIMKQIILLNKMIRLSWMTWKESRIDDLINDFMIFRFLEIVHWKWGVIDF